VTRRWGRRRKKLLDDLGDRRGYSNLKEEALDRIKWRNRFGRGCGPVVWQITYEYGTIQNIMLQPHIGHQQKENQWLRYRQRKTFRPVADMKRRPCQKKICTSIYLLFILPHSFSDSTSLIMK
jgi:hypothetical protein